MNQLCSFTNLTSAEWASWVQAGGTIAAIIGAAGIAIWQSRRQHEASLALMRAEHSLERTELARTLLALSTNCARAIEFVAKQFPDRDAVHRIADQETHFDFNELRIIETAVIGIPLHSLPHTLVSPTLILSSTVRQFREKVESALRFHRQMDSAAFEDFFSVLSQMRRSLEQTCKEIVTEVERSGSEA